VKLLSRDQRKRFATIAPDFAIELRSESDSLKTLQEKLQEYIEQGTQLGWLIDPFARKVEVYRPGKQVEVLDAPATVSGEPELPGFELVMDEIWAEQDGPQTT